MRLSSFIQSTLYEIALGIQLARARSRELVAITPASIDGEVVSEKTYVEFDVAVVVSEKSTADKGGSGKVGAEIEVASIFKANVSGRGKAKMIDTASTEQTYRVAFRVPIYNPLAADDAKGLLSAHGLE